MAFWPALFSKPVAKPLSPRPSLTLFFLIVGAFLLTLLPHAGQLPIWVSLGVVAVMILRAFLEVYRMSMPSPAFLIILAVCLLAGVLLQFRTVAGRDAGTAFTVGLLAIKFYEIRSSRDLTVIIFSCFFVVMSTLLYSQILELFIYCLIMMWVLTALLLRIQVGDLPEDRLLTMLRRSGFIFLQALPLAIFLFFVFPRYTGKLGIPLDENALGLTDTVQPGTIAELARNDTEAMYVRFLPSSGPIPTTDTMYWRALVLWHYEDGTWTSGLPATETLRAPPEAAPGSNLVDQEITIAPHFKKWLFALDAPISRATNPQQPLYWATTLNGDVLQLGGGQDRLEHKTRYYVTSTFTLADENPSTAELTDGLQLPDPIDPRVRALADQLYKDKPDPQDYINAVIHYFRQEHFRYSISPGATGIEDWLPIFLLKTRTGFCEHYASAFAVLMRLEKVPARLVVGYEGADYNPYADIYSVRQSNAHAWDEVWIPAKKHWVRVDPTALLSMGELPSAGSNPDNSDSGSNATSQTSGRPLTFAQSHFPSWLRTGMQDFQLRREEVEADWDNLVFSYDPETQRRMALALGFGENSHTLLGLACLVAIGVCAIFFRSWMRRKPPASPVENLYAMFCRAMAQSGVPRALWEGPLAYTGRVAEAFPDKSQAIRDVGRIVAHVRYGPTPTAATPKELQSLLTLITASQAASSSRETRR